MSQHEFGGYGTQASEGRRQPTCDSTDGTISGKSTQIHAVGDLLSFSLQGIPSMQSKLQNCASAMPPSVLAPGFPDEMIRICSCISHVSPTTLNPYICERSISFFHFYAGPSRLWLRRRADHIIIKALTHVKLQESNHILRTLCRDFPAAP